MSVDFEDEKEEKEWTCSTGESNIMDYGLVFFVQKQQFKDKTPWWISFLQTCSFSLYKMVIDGLEWRGLPVDYCDIFYQLFGLSFWRHPFTVEDPLVSKWCNAKFLQICSDE